MNDEEIPNYAPSGTAAPNEVAAQRVARSVQHHGGPTTGMGAELPALIQHYYQQFMAGPRAMGQAANGELDPTSPEGIRQGMSIAAQTMGMRSAFPMVPHSLGSAGGKMIQPPRGANNNAGAAAPRWGTPSFEPNQYAPPPHVGNGPRFDMEGLPKKAGFEQHYSDGPNSSMFPEDGAAYQDAVVQHMIDKANRGKMTIPRPPPIEDWGGPAPAPRPASPAANVASAFRKAPEAAPEVVGGRERTNLMYPNRPDFHDALVNSGHTYQEVPGADGRMYHQYTKGGPRPW